MKFNILTSTAAFSAVVIATTFGLFLNGANALDLDDFSAIDRKVITQDAPKAGGIALIKEDTVVRNTQQRHTPILTAVSSSGGDPHKEGTYYDYNAISPAAGGEFRDTRPVAPADQPADTLSGRTIPPVASRGIGGPNDSATDPTDPYAAVQARLQSSGAVSPAEPGSAHASAEVRAGVAPSTPAAPLVGTLSTQSMAKNQPSVSDMTDIAPAAGDSTNVVTTNQSGGLFNN